MTAYKCDRCGTLSEFKKGDVLVEYSIAIKIDKEGSPTRQGYEIDLCGQCSREFKAFIDARPKR